MKPNRRNRRTARRLFTHCLVGPCVDEERARQVALRIIESGRRDGLVILSYFARLLKLELTRHRATIQSAGPLPEDLRAHIEGELRRIHGAGLTTSFVRNPALIGGMRVRVGSDVYDGSIRGRLDALEAAFTRGVQDERDARSNR